MPVAAALPELVVVIVAALLVALVLTSAQLYLNGKQARGYAVNLPVIANPVTTAIDALLNAIKSAAHAVDPILNDVMIRGVQGFAALVVLCVNSAGALFISGVHAVQAQAAQLSIDLTHVINVVVPQFHAQLVALANDLGHLRDVVVADLSAQMTLLLTRTVPGLVARLVALETSVTALVPFLGMLQALAGLPVAPAKWLIQDAAAIANLGADVGVIERDLSDIFGRVRTLEDQLADARSTLARLVTLLALAGVGAVALENLLRVARDPCYCLNDGGFSDLPGRVEALENFGP